MKTTFKKWKDKVGAMLLAVPVFTFSMMSSAYAASSDSCSTGLTGVGCHVNRVVNSNVVALLGAVLAVMGFVFLIKRKWLEMISFFAIAMVIIIFSDYDTVHKVAIDIKSALGL